MVEVIFITSRKHKVDKRITTSSDLDAAINYITPLNIIGLDFEATGLDALILKPLLMIVGNL